jgi:hypothetical protein
MRDRHKPYCDIEAHLADGMDHSAGIVSDCVGPLQAEGAAAQWVTDSRVGAMIAVDITGKYFSPDQWHRFCLLGLELVRVARRG